MSKIFIGWGYSKTDVDAVVNCGEFTTPEEAVYAVNAAGLRLAEVETEYRTAPPAVFHKTSTIKAEKKGEFIRFKVDGPVWVRSDYDKATKKFCCYKFDDVNHCTYKSGATVCFSGFDF